MNTTIQKFSYYSEHLYSIPGRVINTVWSNTNRTVAVAMAGSEFATLWSPILASIHRANNSQVVEEVWELRE